MRDEAVLAKTGRTWEQWVRELDRHGAETPHRDVVSMLLARVRARVLVVANGHRWLRANQGTACAWTEARRQLRGNQVVHVQRAGRDAVQRLGRREHPAPLVDRHALSACARRPRPSRYASALRMAGSSPSASSPKVGPEGMVALSEAKLRDRAAAARGARELARATRYTRPGAGRACGSLSSTAMAGVARCCRCVMRGATDRGGRRRWRAIVSRRGVISSSRMECLWIASWGSTPRRRAPCCATWTPTSSVLVQVGKGLAAPDIRRMLAGLRGPGDTTWFVSVRGGRL